MGAITEAEGGLGRAIDRGDASGRGGCPREGLRSPGKLRAIELFSGCGGLALGMARAGIDHGLLVEWNKWPARPWR